MLSLKKVLFKDNKEQIEHPFLCDQIKEFGFCEGPCLKRHTLCKTLDKECLSIPTKCFINIQLTTIISASHFYGRILKYSVEEDPTKNQDWINVDDSFEIIKNELKNVSSHSIVHKTPIIGEMVMVETKDKEFFRAVVLDIFNGWIAIKVKVRLIDLGLTEEIYSNNVYLLPNYLKQFRPVAVEIIVSSMVPVGEGGGSLLKWPITTTNVVHSLLEPIILMDLEFICKVEHTLGITLWIDWILVKKCIKCSHFICKLYKNPLILPRELIERNIAITSSQLIDKIIDLSKIACMWKEQSKVDKCLPIKNIDKSLFPCEKQKIEINEVIKVQWAHLSEDEIFNVSVCYIVDPKCILVRNLKFNDIINALQKDIDKAVNDNIVKPLTCAIVGTVCLAISPDSKQYNRARIQEIDDKSAVVLYIDYGDIYKVKIEYLLTISSSLITYLPFQVIECNLSGFNNILETDIVDQFIDRFLQFISTNMYLKVLSSSVDTRLTEGNSYEIVLFNKDININVTMADEFNRYVDNTQIQDILRSNYKNDEYKNEDDEYDEVEFQTQLELLESLMKMSTETNEKKNVLNSTNSCQDIIANNSIKIDEIQNESNLIQDITDNNKQEKYVNVMNTFCQDCNAIPIVPQCFWHQDEKWIFLKLNIIAVNNYNISHTMDTISINVVTNSVTYFFTAALYISITKESFTYRVGFDGFYIKAQKLISNEDQWPRLLKCPKKHKYIIYDTEFLNECNDESLINVLSKYKLMSLGQPLNITNYESDSDSTEDSDDEYRIFEDRF